MTEQKRKIILSGQDFYYILTRKKVKNINLRIKTRGEIHVSASHSIPVPVIEDFLRQKERWILSALEQLQQTEVFSIPEGHVFFCGELIPLPQGMDRLLWQKEQAAMLLPDVYEQVWKLYEKDGFSKPVLKLRRMKSRWGSCMPAKGMITLNTALIGASPDCQLAVACHELTHMLYHGHNSTFYQCLLAHCPSYMDCWQKLKQTQKFLIDS